MVLLHRQFTGTPYIGQEYFTDVVYRYALKDGWKRSYKSVEYLIEPAMKENEGFPGNLGQSQCE